MSPSLSPTRNRGLQTPAPVRRLEAAAPVRRLETAAPVRRLETAAPRALRIDAPELGGPGDALDGQDVGGLPVVDLRSVETLEPFQLG